MAMVFCCISCNKETATESSEKGKETAIVFAEKFIDISKNGNIEMMYELYYNDMLNDTYERVKDFLTKEQFNSMIQQEMTSITDYELFVYGSQEMPSTFPPLYYVDYLYYRTTGSETGLSEDIVTNCANLRVYIDNGYTDHMIAEINGEWYVIS